jgi:hypothetical protein
MTKKKAAGGVSQEARELEHRHETFFAPAAPAIERLVELRQACQPPRQLPVRTFVTYGAYEDPI